MTSMCGGLLSVTHSIASAAKMFALQRCSPAGVGSVDPEHSPPVMAAR